MIQHVNMTSNEAEDREHFLQVLNTSPDMAAVEFHTQMSPTIDFCQFVKSHGYGLDYSEWDEVLGEYHTRFVRD